MKSLPSFTFDAAMRTPPSGSRPWAWPRFGLRCRGGEAPAGSPLAASRRRVKEPGSRLPTVRASRSGRRGGPGQPRQVDTKIGRRAM